MEKLTNGKVEFFYGGFAFSSKLLKPCSHWKQSTDTFNKCQDEMLEQRSKGTRFYCAALAALIAWTGPSREGSIAWFDQIWAAIKAIRPYLKDTSDWAPSLESIFDICSWPCLFGNWVLINLKLKNARGLLAVPEYSPQSVGIKGITCQCWASWLWNLVALKGSKSQGIP